MDTTPIFATPVARKYFKSASEILMANTEQSLEYSLGTVLGIIGNYADEFDQRCPVNGKWLGTSLINRVSVVAIDTERKKLEAIVAMVYRLLVEFDVAMKNELSPELKGFIRQVDLMIDELAVDAREEIRYARHEMPLSILKNMLNSEELGTLTNVSAVAAQIEGKLGLWDLSLRESERKVSQLSDALKEQRDGFNFVGLHKGFSNLSASLTKELKFAQVTMVAFGMLAMLPSAVDLWLVLSEKISLTSADGYTLIAVLISTITITLLLLYFFRIALRKADSCRAQLVQVSLRMSLCQFIQSYAEYSTEIKTKNPDALSKFEALIFSGIVSNEDKLPSTFDGIEQLSSLAKVFRGDSK